MRKDLIERMVNNLMMDQRFRKNALFPKTFYDLTKQEQAEVIKRYKQKNIYRPPKSEEKAK